MIYGYIRVSTDKQTTENQRFEILKYADEKKLAIDEWIEETVSATKNLSHRKLGALLTRMQKNDILIVSELSRLGRSLMEVMRGVIAPFPRYEVLKSPFPEFAFSPGKHLVFAKQWVVKIPVCGRLS